MKASLQGRAGGPFPQRGPLPLRSAQLPRDSRRPPDPGGSSRGGGGEAGQRPAATPLPGPVPPRRCAAAAEVSGDRGRSSAGGSRHPETGVP